MPAIPYSRFVDEILAVYRATRAPATVRKMATVLGMFGGLPAVRKTADISPPNVAAFLAPRQALNPHTLRGYLSYLRAAGAYAVARSYLKASPFDAVKSWVKGHPVPRLKHHDFESISRVFSLLETEAQNGWREHRLFALFSTVALTGLRKSEALHLRREDYDGETGCLSIVERQAHRLKTEASAQPVPCPDRLREVLDAWLLRADQVDSDSLFPGATGERPWTGGSPGYRPLDCLKAAGLRAGVEGLTFLSLRHTYATMAESRWQFGEALIQRLLRHTRPLTQRHYRHADASNLRAAVADVHFDPVKSPEITPEIGGRTPWPGRPRKRSASAPAIASAS